MNRLFATLFLSFLFGASEIIAANETDDVSIAKEEGTDKGWSIAIHGGAGVIKRANLSVEREAAIRAKLDEALAKGSAILANGGSSMDAITATIMILEDDPNFNAGKGAVFTWEGANELDASIMDGKTRNAGAAAGVQYTKNPILLARAVMENSRHVLLSGAGADQFSREQGLEQVDPQYFYTQSRFDSLQRYKAAQTKRDAEKAAAKTSVIDVKSDALGRDYRFGTVGAVAIDKAGNIAAGTSTGGLTGKRWGRIGDAPIIGAGTYADNRSCGISATGAGEYFIRVGVAHEICTRIRLRFRELIKEEQASVPKNADGTPEFLIHVSEFPFDQQEVQRIADEVIAEQGNLGGSGGIIYVTPWGQSGFSFDTPGMYRARGDSNGTKIIAIYDDE